MRDTGLLRPSVLLGVHVSRASLDGAAGSTVTSLCEPPRSDGMTDAGSAGLDLWQEPALVPPRPGDPPTALAIVLLCSACALYAVVAFALQWWRASAICKAKEPTSARRHEVAIQYHEQGDQTKRSPTRSGNAYLHGRSHQYASCLRDLQRANPLFALFVVRGSICGTADVRENERRAQTLDITNIFVLDEAPPSQTRQPVPSPRPVDRGRPRELAFLSDESDRSSDDSSDDSNHGRLPPLQRYSYDL